MSGISLVNDGNGNGCYNNVIEDVYINKCPEGLSINMETAEINTTNVFNLVITDCQSYGIREYVGASVGAKGRNNKYRNIDIEKCNIGIEVHSKNFLIDGGYFEFNNTAINVKSSNGLHQQSGSIRDVSILGKYNFPGITSEDTVGISVVGSKNLKLESIWNAYNETGVYTDSTSDFISIDQYFFENNNRDFNFQDDKKVHIRNGSQNSSSTQIIVPSGDTTYTIDPQQVNTVFELGNYNINVDMDLSQNYYKNGFYHTIVPVMDSSHTGSITISDTSGGLFFGQLGGSRVGYASSITIGYNQSVKLVKHDNAWVVFGMGN